LLVLGDKLAQDLRLGRRDAHQIDGLEDRVRIGTRVEAYPYAMRKGAADLPLHEIHIAYNIEWAVLRHRGKVLELPYDAKRERIHDAIKANIDIELLSGTFRQALCDGSGDEQPVRIGTELVHQGAERFGRKIVPPVDD